MPILHGNAIVRLVVAILAGLTEWLGEWLQGLFIGGSVVASGTAAGVCMQGLDLRGCSMYALIAKTRNSHF